MLLVYKYIQDRRRNAQAAEQVKDSSLPPPLTHTRSTDDSAHEDALAALESSSPSSEAKRKKRFHISPALKRQLLLIAALVLPVFVETLDYTGAQRFEEYQGLTDL